MINMLEPIFIEENQFANCADTSNSYLIFVEKDSDGNPCPSDKAVEYFGHDFLEKFFKLYDFKADKFKTISTLKADNGQLTRIIALAIPDLKEFDNDSWLKLGGAVASATKGCKSLNILLDFDKTL